VDNVRVVHEEVVMSEYAAFVGIDIAVASANVVVKLGGQPMGTILPLSRIIQSQLSN